MVHSDLNEFSRDFHVDIATEAEKSELESRLKLEYTKYI